MNFQNDRYTIRLADNADDDGIREIFESGSFSGGLNIQYLRGKRPLDSFRADGDDAKVLVAVDNRENRIIAVGGAVVRREYLCGSIENCAYLTGLKIHPDYQGKTLFIAGSYQFLREQLSGCRCCYTTILDDNKAVIAMLEKKHRNMPEYRYLGHYTTYCFSDPKKILPLEIDNTDGFDELMRSHFSKQALTPADPDLPGFGDKHFYCIRENGRIKACCFVGDQSVGKSYKMCSYGGIYRLLAHLPTRLAGYPAFPKAGEMIRHGVVSYLYVEGNDPKLCSDLLRSVAAYAGFSLLIWGAFENNPLCGAMDLMKTIHYGSRLYEVVWDQAVNIPGVIGVEAALL